MRIETNVGLVPFMRLMFPTTGILFSVDENAPVTAVQEGYALGPHGTEQHRYQVLLVPQGNVVSAFWSDLGPAEGYLMHVDGKAYQAPPYFQVVLSEHSVAECRYMAEEGRMDDFAIRLLHEQVNESDLFARYQQLIEEDLRLVKNRSSFGPHARIERNGYSAYGARRQQEVLRGQ